MTDIHPTTDPQARIERLLITLLLGQQRQAIAIAHLQDEISVMRASHAAGTAQVAEAVHAAARRSDWFDVQAGHVLKVLLAELREVRATQVCSALADGPLTAQTLADLIHRGPLDDLILELPDRASRPTV